MKKFRPMLIGALASCLYLSLTAASASANLLFEDDFATGDLSKANSYFRWGRSGAVARSGEGSDRIVRVTGPNGSAVNAIRFEYMGLNTSARQDDKYWKEERFHLTNSLSESRNESGAGSTAYPEVWISYWLRVPDNYAHGPNSPSNNKGFVTLWKNQYMGPVGSAIDWWHTGSGRSRIGAWIGENGVNPGNLDEPSFIRADHRVGTSRQAYAFLPTENGKWVHVAVGMRISSNGTSRNGFIQVYKNGERVIAWENLNNWNSNASLQGYDRGYLLGWHNSGYTQTTTFYLTGVRFATSVAGAISGVGAPAAVTAPPAAPTLRVN